MTDAPELLSDDGPPPIVSARRPEHAVPVFSLPHLRGMSLPWRLQRDRPMRVVALKATYDLDPATGALRRREEGDPILGDEHVGEPPLSSLRYPSDVAIIKARCDVVLWGPVYGSGRRTVEARFAFGDPKDAGFDRRMKVQGLRLARGAKPDPFDSITPTWELASYDARHNPVGRRKLDELPPQLEAVGESGPAGFGPIPMMWPVRLERFGTLDATWYEEHYPYFAPDFHPEAYQCAPRAQQLVDERGDERFLIEGFSERRRPLEGRLPGDDVLLYAIQPSADGGRWTEVQTRLDTVVFDLERLTVSLVWRGSHETRDDDASDLACFYARTRRWDETPPLEAEVPPFYRLYAPDDESPTGWLLPHDPTAAAQATTAGSNDGASDEEAARQARERLIASGMPAHLLEPVVPDEPPPEPEPRRWLPAEACPGRAAAVAWLAGGERPEPTQLSGAELSALDFSGRDLSGFDLRGAHLEDCRFEGTRLEEAELGETVAPRAVFDGALLDRADLTGAVVDDASFVAAHLAEALLERCRGEGTRFDRIVAPDANFTEARLPRSSFEEATLDGAYFSEAALTACRFTGASLRDARLYDADASEARFEDADLSEVRGDGIRLARARCDRATADEAVMDDADLTEVRWCQASLKGASFCRAHAPRAQLLAVSLRQGRLTGACLDEADLRGSDLFEADLGGASLERADVRGANLYGAELYEARVTDLKTDGAHLGNTVLAGGPP